MARHRQTTATAARGPLAGLEARQADQSTTPPLWVLVVLLTALVLTVLVAVTVDSGSAAGRSSSSSTGPVAGQYAGTTPLGCEATYTTSGSRQTVVNPFCTNTALVKKVCDVDWSGITPTLTESGSSSLWTWSSSFTSAWIQGDSTPGATYLMRMSCSTSAYAHNVAFTPAEWQQLINVGTELTPELQAKLVGP